MRLCHCFMDLIAYGVYYRAGKADGDHDMETVRRDILQRVETSERLSRQNGFSPEDYDMARFAVLVWMDEIIMRSPREGKSYWKKNLLQRQFYKISDGGVQFYKRLEKLEPEENGIREVYYLCLASGFSGMYGFSHEDMAVREHIRAMHLKRLTGTSDGIASAANELLFTESYCHDYPTDPGGQSEKSGMSFVVAFVVLSPLAVLAAMYLLYRFILNHEMVTKLVP